MSAPGASSASLTESPLPADEGLGKVSLQILHHAWPVLGAQLLSMGMMIADTLIAGHYGTRDLAAVAVGSGLYISVVMLLAGVLQSVSPIVAHHFGAGRLEAIGPAVRQGFWLAGMLALPGCLLLAFPQWLLSLADVPAEVAPLVRDYLLAVAVGVPAVLAYRTFYASANALGKPRALLVISALTLTAHIPLAYALSHGTLGFAPLGAVGCGLSTALTSWVACGWATLYLTRNPTWRRYRLFADWGGPRRAAFAEMLRLGAPMGLSSFIEISSFTLIALLVARLGADTVAGHRVVGNLAALVYMLPLALSIAVLVLVGQAMGAGRPRRARVVIRAGMLLSTAICAVVGLLLWLLRDTVVGWFSADPAVRAVALSLIFYICLYLFFDSVQTVAAHALRGLKVTLAPMWMHSLCFWGVGLAGGYWAAFLAPGRVDAPSVAGFWEASVVATVLASVLFGALLRWVLARRGA